MSRSVTSPMKDSVLFLLDNVLRPLIFLTKAMRHRREIMQLAEFDDRMLKDIGLVRSDVESALAEPIFSNPSWVLVRCAERHGRTDRVVVAERPNRPVVPFVVRA